MLDLVVATGCISLIDAIPSRFPLIKDATISARRHPPGIVTGASIGMAALLLTLAVPALSASPGGTLPQSVLTLGEAIELASLAAPSIEATDAGIRAAAAQRRVAGLRPNPSLVAESGNIAGSGIYQGTQSAENTVGLSVPVELGGKRTARLGVAAAASSRAAIDSDIAGADLRLQVTLSYNEALAADRRTASANAQVGVAADALKAARARVAAGRASPIEVQRGELMMINAEAEAARAARTAALAVENLARLIGRAPGSLDTVWFDRIILPTLNSAPATSMSVAVAQAEVTAAEARIAVARSQRVSDITVSAGARRLQQTNDTAAVFGVSIPLGIFNNGSANVAVVTAERDRAEALHRAAVRDAERDVAAAEADLINAVEAARVATGPALAAAAEAARIARIGYREGKFGQLELLEAERSLLQTRSAAIDALAAYHGAAARLERLTAPSSSNLEGGQ